MNNDVLIFLFLIIACTNFLYVQILIYIPILDNAINNNV